MQEPRYDDELDEQFEGGEFAVAMQAQFIEPQNLSEDNMVLT